MSTSFAPIPAPEMFTYSGAAGHVSGASWPELAAGAVLLVAIIVFNLWMLR